MRETKATSSRPRVTRYARDLVIELKKVTAALEKASAVADALAGAGTGVAAPRVARYARDLAVQVAKADAALKKAKKLAASVTRNARTVVMKKKVTRYSKDL